MIKKMTIAVVTMLMTLFMVGVVSAAPSIDICTDSPSTCASSGTLTVYQGVDASVNPGLRALFQGWDTTSATYTVSIVDVDASPDVVVYGPIAGSIDADPKNVYYAWTPEVNPAKLGIGKYKIRAQGLQESTLEADITVRTSPNVVPELPTSALLSVGLIGLIGMLKFRRKD